jgi:hypothetical protein
MGSYSGCRADILREQAKPVASLCRVAQPRAGVTLLAARWPSAKAFAASRDPMLGSRSWIFAQQNEVISDEVYSRLVVDGRGHAHIDDVRSAAARGEVGREAQCR